MSTLLQPSRACPKCRHDMAHVSTLTIFRGGEEIEQFKFQCPQCRGTFFFDGASTGQTVLPRNLDDYSRRFANANTIR